MSFTFDVASVLAIAIGCGYILLAGVAYFSYEKSGSKTLLIFIGAFVMLFFMNLYGGVAGAYHPFDSTFSSLLLGGFTFNGFSTSTMVEILSDITIKNTFAFDIMGVSAIILFVIALFKA
ncbi:MAG: hypothetical protein WED07_09490 [Candidatus Freyarchaeum deiterrae]